MYRLVVIALLAAGTAAAQEPLSLESVANRYFALSSYCDSGKRSWRDNPQQPFIQELSFRRCARADGRFKSVEADPRSRSAEVKWADADHIYRWLEWGRRYQELPFNDASLYGYYEVRSEIFAVFVFEAFSSDARSLVRKDERARYLRSFSANAALSTPQYAVFERLDPGGRSGERLWVRSADRSIFRHQTLRDGGVVRLVEVETFEMNRALDDDELRHKVPLLARYSLMNNPRVFMGGLVVAAGILGAGFWTLLLVLGMDLATKRGRLWRVQAWAFGVIAVLLGALAVLTAGGGGHPPAIVYVYVLGVWCAVVLAMTALFTLASYPVEFVARKLVHRA